MLKVAFSLMVLAITSVFAQSAEEQRLMEAVRTGKLKLTDEVIDIQRKLHPELNSMSNEEIRSKFEAKARSEVNLKESDSSDTAGSKQDRQRADRQRADRQGADRQNADRPMDGTQEREGKAKDEDDGRFPPGLKRFGYDFFVNENATASLAGSAPALPEYVLSPGDEIQIYTWGRENQTLTVPIDNEGMLHYPPLQPIRLAGLKFQVAQGLLTRELEKISGVKASVGMGKLKSIRVFVLGEVTSPGSYVVPAGATVTTALFRSGGIRDIGSLRGIQLKRDAKVIANLDLYDMLLKGNSHSDQQLLTGDVVFVPVAPIQVAITGRVKRAGIYEVKAGTKVLDVLELAGGLSSNAFKGRVRLDRIENHKRKVALDVGMEKMGGNANVTLQDGDMLNVEEVLSREYDVVYLEGNVNRPGRYEFRKGMTIRDLLPSVKDLRSETFFSYGHIKRSTEDEQRSVLLPFSLKEVFDQNASVPLMPRDTVIVYNRYDIMDQPEVKISGTIRKPGRYPFVDKMKVSDLVIAGGGLTVEAYLPEAHLIRVLKIQESDSLFSVLKKINLANLIDNPGDENNLELKPSDSLIIYPRSNFVLPKWVSIVGAVKKPGTYELTQDMGIPELISQADGLLKSSFRLRVEVVRKVLLQDSVVKREIHQLNLKDIVEGKAVFRLQDADAVYLRDVVDNNKEIVVSLGGEFNFPGRYEAAKDERLSSVIRRAGGFNNAAYLRGAVFIRKSVKERQLQAVAELERRLQAQLENMLNQTTSEKDRDAIQAAIGQRKTMLAEVKTAPYLGRVVVNLDTGLSLAGKDEDILLEDGDSLFVRPASSTISILGEVYSPTNVIVSAQNNDIGDCIDKAGGVNEYGDGKNTYYMRPDGTVLTPKNTSFFRMRSVEPGGVIIVPPKGPKKDYLDALTKITQIIYQIAITVGVANTLF